MSVHVHFLYLFLQFGHFVLFYLMGFVSLLVKLAHTFAYDCYVFFCGLLVFVDMPALAVLWFITIPQIITLMLVIHSFLLLFFVFFLFLLMKSSRNLPDKARIKSIALLPPISLLLWQFVGKFA